MSKLDWLEFAACATADGSIDPDFFPVEKRGNDKAYRRTVSRAKAKCDGVPVVVRGDNGEAVVKWGTRPCPVRDRCLALAMDNEGHMTHKDRDGIFGGLTPKERHALQLQRVADGEVEPPTRVAKTRRRECTRPGTDLGAGRHLEHGEAACKACEPFMLSDVELETVARMVREGYTNPDIYRRTMATSAHVRAVRVLEGKPDPTGNDARDVNEGIAARRRRGYDESKVERRMAGYTASDNDWSLRLTGQERQEVVRRGHALGYSDGEISRRFGIHARQVHRDRVELGLATNFPQERKDAAA